MLDYFHYSVTSRYFGLIPAAGSGERFGGPGPKQYSQLAGRPMLFHAAERLLGAPEVELVLVVLASGDGEFAKHDWSMFGKRLAPLYCGGATRRDSVLNGLVASSGLLDADDWVLVHDAARPCLGRTELRRLIAEVGTDDIGGILAVPVADTLKRADAERRIASTERREGLWQAQTPQMFRQGLLMRALREAPLVTDEAAAVEALGLRPKLVKGNPGNLKVTYPADLDMAQRILEDKA